MVIKFSITIGRRTSNRWSLDDEATKDFEIDYPDDLPIPDFSTAFKAASDAALQAHLKLVAEAPKE